MQRSDFNIPRKFFLLLIPFVVLFLLTLYSCKPEDFMPQGSANSGGNAQGGYESDSRGGEESGESKERADSGPENGENQPEDGGESSETEKDGSGEEGRGENRESSEEGDSASRSDDDKSGEENYKPTEPSEDGERGETRGSFDKRDSNDFHMCIDYSYPEEAKRKESKRENGRDRFDNTEEAMDAFENTQRVQIDRMFDDSNETKKDAPFSECGDSADLYDISAQVQMLDSNYEITFFGDSIGIDYFKDETWTGVKFDGYTANFPENSIWIDHLIKTEMTEDGGKIKTYEDICGKNKASLKVLFGFEFPDGQQLEQDVVSDDLISIADCKGQVPFNKEAVKDGYEQAYKIKIDEAKYLLTIFELYADNKLVAKAVLKFKKPALSTK